jgi:hypothetical protein
MGSRTVSPCYAICAVLGEPRHKRQIYWTRWLRTMELALLHNRMVKQSTIPHLIPVIINFHLWPTTLLIRHRRRMVDHEARLAINCKRIIPQNKGESLEPMQNWQPDPPRGYQFVEGSVDNNNRVPFDFAIGLDFLDDRDSQMLQMLLDRVSVPPFSTGPTCSA